MSDNQLKQTTESTPQRSKRGRKTLGDKPLTPKEASQRYRDKLKNGGGTTITIRIDADTANLLAKYQSDNSLKSMSAAALQAIKCHLQ